MTILSKSPHRWRIETRAESSIDKLFDLEYDLRSTTWILERARTTDSYAQNLYAALCNNSFKKVVVKDTPENLIRIMMEEAKIWTCSWRYAGGIIADMRQEGDYMDWYCSGITSLEDEEKSKYVSEGCVTEEIRENLRDLGWIVLEDKE